MSPLTIVLLLVLLLGIMAYLRATLALWTTLGFALLLASSHVANYSIVSLALVLLWMPLMLLNLPSLRRRLGTDRVYGIMRKLLPSMSATERDAIAAGTVWWDAQLFSGKPDWSLLRNTRLQSLSAEEQAFIDGPVQQLCDMVDDWHITHEELDLTPEIWQFIRSQGFFGMIIPRQYGGLGFSALAHSTVVMKISTRSISTAVTVMVPNSLGPAELLLRYGTQEQRDYYLPRLARGEEIPCFALTGPEAGSDAGAMPDHGIVCRGEYQGRKDVLGMRVNWNKRYITLGPVATLLGLAFKLYDPEHLLGGEEDLGITLALIPTDTPGVSIGHRHFPLNQAFQNGPNWGKDVFVPMDWIIGGEQQIGQGWRMLMDCLSVGRSISLPALSTGGGKLACRATGAYARIRRQFKLPIGRFEGVQEVLARMAARTYMMDAARQLTATAVDLGEKPAVLSAICKYHLTESMRQIVNDAMDIQGGSGICMGPRNLLARIYQAIPISITVEGANILTRSMIIFGQGAIRCHPHVLQEMEALADADGENGRRRFDRAFTAHVGFTISNAVRSLLLGLSRGQLVLQGSRHTRRCYRQLSHLSAAFAFCADMAMLVMGGNLKRRESLSARLGDALSHLYLASAVLKKFENDNEQLEDLPLLQWCMADLVYRCQQTLLAVFDNFPNRMVALLMRVICFPAGRPYQPPRDQLGRHVADILIQPGLARDRLSEYVHLPQDPTATLAKLEQALPLIIEAETLEKKLQQALKKGLINGPSRETQLQAALQAGVLGEQDCEILRHAWELQQDIIQVDYFTAEEIKLRRLEN